MLWFWFTFAYDFSWLLRLFLFLLWFLRFLAFDTDYCLLSLIFLDWFFIGKVYRFFLFCLSLCNHFLLCLYSLFLLNLFFVLRHYLIFYLGIQLHFIDIFLVSLLFFGTRSTSVICSHPDNPTLESSEIDFQGFQISDTEIQFAIQVQPPSSLQLGPNSWLVDLLLTDTSVKVNLPAPFYTSGEVILLPQQELEMLPNAPLRWGKKFTKCSIQ